MTFRTPTDIRAVIYAGDEIERVRARNRMIVDNLFNGGKPIPDEDAVRMNQSLNINWGEAPVLKAHAVRQLTNAFQRPVKKFRVTIPTAPQDEDKQIKWGMAITDFINRVIKESPGYFRLLNNRFNDVVSHGVAPQLWEDKETWLARYVAIGDFRVATDTEVGFRNLEWFAVRYYYTTGELWAKVFSEDSSKNWNKKAVGKILEEYRNKNTSAGWDSNWFLHPEKIAELRKQNGGCFMTDAVPTIPLWHFFAKERDKKRKERWEFRVIPDNTAAVEGADPDEFLYDAGDESYANDLSEILYCQYGDLGCTSPAMHWSVRSLGFLLVEPCFWTNQTLNRMIQYLFESFNTWFRVVDPAGRARAMEINLADRKIIPEGVSIVPKDQRHSVDSGMIDAVMSKLKQLQSEASSSYTQQSDNGTQKEQTAYETSVKVAQVNAMMSGILLNAFHQAKFEYKEICRRFCIRNSGCPDVRAFQKMCKRMGIPAMYMNVELWDIEPEVPLGAGNPTIEAAEAQQLMAFRPLLGPEAQQKALHIAIAATMKNYNLAEDLVPLNEKPVSTRGSQWAASIFGTLMQGVPVPVNESVPATEVIETLIGMLAGAIHAVEQTDNIGTPKDLIGFGTVMSYIGGLIQNISGDQALGPQIQAYSKSLGELANLIRGFQKRQQQQSQNGHDKEAMMEMQLKAAKAENDMKIKQAKTQQGLAHKDAAFRADQARKSATLQTDIQRKGLEAGAQIQRDTAVTAADVAHEQALTMAEIAHGHAKTSAEIEQANRKANQSTPAEE